MHTPQYADLPGIAHWRRMFPRLNPLPYLKAQNVATEGSPLAQCYGDWTDPDTWPSGALWLLREALKPETPIGKGRPDQKHVQDWLVHHHPDMVWLDVLTQDVMYRGEPFSDWHEPELIGMFREHTGKSPTVTDIRGGVGGFAHHMRRDRAQEWLASVDWDGQPRVDMILGLMNVDNTDMAARMLFVWSAGMVNRIQTPGAKADHILILVGEQGVGKTTTLECIAGDPDWCTSVSLGVVLGDQSILARRCQGSTIVNIDEYGSIPRAKREAVKAFTTLREDRFNVKYQRADGRSPRRFVLAGTSNDTEILSDPTGDRRAFPMVVQGPISPDAQATLKYEWPRWLAEVRTRLEQGERGWLNQEDLRDLGEAQREEFREVSDLEQRVHANLDRFQAAGIQAFLVWEAFLGDLDRQEAAGETPLSADSNWERQKLDRGLEHRVVDAIRSWVGKGGARVLNRRVQLRRADGSRKRHYTVGVKQGVKTRTLDDGSASVLRAVT